MNRLLAVAALLFWGGLTLLFASIPALQRPRLADRLRPYTPGAPIRGRGIRAARSTREVVGPLAQAIGALVSRAFGVHEDVALRLERLHDPEGSAEFRVRQLMTAALALVLTAMGLSIVRLPALVLFGSLWVPPLLSFLIIEQRLANRSARRQRQVELELPVIAEQLAMLLGAGFSLGAALQRLGGRSDGAISTDLRRVTRRIRQGVTESDALDEWATVAGVASVRRLVAVLRLHGETSDLGRLVTEEARLGREEQHRTLLEAMERKAQAVWIPVTVAALVPGVIFLSVPFMHALSFFADQ